MLAELMQRPLASGAFWNVNLPYVESDAPDPKIIFCQPCTQLLPVDFRVEGNSFFYGGEYAKWQRDRSSDVDICLSGNIAVTQISL